MFSRNRKLILWHAAEWIRLHGRALPRLACIFQNWSHQGVESDFHVRWVLIPESSPDQSQHPVFLSTHGFDVANKYIIGNVLHPFPSWIGVLIKAKHKDVIECLGIDSKVLLSVSRVKVGYPCVSLSQYLLYYVMVTSIT